MTIERGYVGQAGRQVHFRTAGAGAPIVILHMTPSSSLSWEATIDDLAGRGYRVIAFDTPGFGLSDRLDDEPSIDGWAERIAGAAEALGLRDYFLFGHHTGASVAAAIAARWPERVRKMALWGFAAQSEEARARSREAPISTISESGDELLERWNAWKRLAGDRFSPAVGIRYVLEVLQAGPAWSRGHHVVAETDHEALAGRVQTETLLLCGDRDVLWPQCRDCATLFPNGRFVAIDGGGVDVFDQFPGELAAALDSFFRG